MWEMIEPIFRGRFSPIRLLFLMFGIELMKKENENEMDWYIVVMPNKGVEMKQLIKTGKQLFDLSDRDYSLEELLKSWADGSIGRFHAWDFFRIDGLSVEDVAKVREKCRATRHYKIVDDQLLQWSRQVDHNAKMQLRKELTEKAVAKKVKDSEHLLDEQNKDGLLPQIYETMDEFRDHQGNEPA